MEKNQTKKQNSNLFLKKKVTRETNITDFVRDAV